MLCYTKLSAESSVSFTAEVSEEDCMKTTASNTKQLQELYHLFVVAVFCELMNDASILNW